MYFYPVIYVKNCILRYERPTFVSICQSIVIFNPNFERLTIKLCLMRKQLLLLSVSVFLITCVLKAQNEEAFKPNGKAEVDIFTNFSSSFAGDENHNKFDIGRAYLGYVYNFTGKLTGRVTYDAGNLSLAKSHFTGFLKFAYLEYHTGKWKINGGMIMPQQFDYTNSKWGYRYIYKPMHDEYGFGYSSDLGFSVEHTFSSWLKVDAIVANGESFKLTEMDSTLRTGVGVIVKPFKNGALRGYYDRMKKESANQQTFELTASYENPKCKLGLSYSHQTDHALIAGQDYEGLTLNGTLILPKNQKIWARFDHVSSKKVGNAAHPWNYPKDGSLYMIGFEIIPTRGVNISPNIQGWQPADANKPFTTRFCLSVDIKV